MKRPPQTAKETAESAVYHTALVIHPAILWSCGSEKIAEAEQLLKGKPEIPSTIVVKPELPKSEPKKPGALVIQGGQ
jgi:hypothetical protein